MASATGNDTLSGGTGNDTFIVGEGEGNNIVHGSFGGGWTDTLTVQNSDGTAVTDGWTVAYTSGGEVRPNKNGITLTDDSAGTITLIDGTTVDLDGIDVTNW